MGIKIFDLPPNGLKDGAVADINPEQSISTEKEVLTRNVEKDGTETKITKDNEIGPVVRGEIIEERTSPEDPIVRKYVQYDANDRIVSSDPEGSEEFIAAVGEQGQSGVRASMKTKMALHMLRVELPLEVIDEINSHIEEELDGAVDLSDKLVGQINRNEKSAQIEFNLNDEVGKLVKGQIDKAGKSYVNNGFALLEHIKQFISFVGRF